LLTHAAQQKSEPELAEPALPLRLEPRFGKKENGAGEAPSKEAGDRRRSSRERLLLRLVDAVARRKLFRV